MRVGSSETSGSEWSLQEILDLLAVAYVAGSVDDDGFDSVELRQGEIASVSLSTHHAASSLRPAACI
jgi:hypothetical protein